MGTIHLNAKYSPIRVGHSATVPVMRALSASHLTAVDPMGILLLFFITLLFWHNAKAVMKKYFYLAN